MWAEHWRREISFHNVQIFLPTKWLTCIIELVALIQSVDGWREIDYDDSGPNCDVDWLD